MLYSAQATRVFLSVSFLLIHPHQINKFVTYTLIINSLHHKNMKKSQLVFIPSPGTGHLIATVEFAEKLISHNDQFSVIILVMKPAFEVANIENSSNSTSQSLISSQYSQIQFIDLPRPPQPPSLQLVPKSGEKYITLYVESHRSQIKDFIHKHVLTNSVPIAGFVFDMFCTGLVELAEQISVPSYLFLTSGAGFFGFLLYEQTRHAQVGTEFEKSDPDSNIPSYINPVPTRVLPDFAFNKEGGHESLMNHTKVMTKMMKGIIINTVFELESHAMSSFLESETPPIYTVGPLIDLKGQKHHKHDKNQRDVIMKWLDNQPPKSVVFLCFGSMGSFEVSQLKEIAIGLERAGLRFLWSVRKRQTNHMSVMPNDYSNLDEFLPKGFLDRTKELGMLCSWAPQVEILAHKAIGGFVSHCGWNSTLESLWHGVPIVTWPLYAEQQINAFQLVKDLGLAVELRLDNRRYGDDFITANEIEKAVRCVIEGNDEVRKRVEEMSLKLRRAVMDGGSSFVSFRRLIEAISENMS